MFKASILALSCALLLPGVAHANEKVNMISLQPISNIGKHKKSKANHKNLVQRILRPKYFTHLYQVGIASWYGLGDGFQGARMASGKRFDTYALTVAHRYLPFGTKIRILNPINGKSIVAVVEDRGPYARGRILDMSYAVKTALGIRGGTAQVVIYR